nr:hypothetical protein [Tanacetum cinerariifolium]
MARDGSVFKYYPDYLREQFVGLVIKRALPFNHFDHKQTTRVFQNIMQPRYTHSQDYSMSQGSGHSSASGSAHGSGLVHDDSPVEEMSPVKKPSKRASRAKKNDAKDKEQQKTGQRRKRLPCAGLDALCQKIARKETV